MKTAILYEITNTLNGGKYIGVTTLRLKERWAVHLYKLRHNIAPTKIQEDFNKYGEAAFCIKEIKRGELYEMLILEKELTKETVINGYNSIIGGGDSEERKGASLVFRKYLKDNPTEAFIFYKRIRDSNIGKKHSEDTKAKMSVAKKGKLWSDEYKTNRSKAYSGNGNPNYGNYKIYLNNQTGIFYTTPELQSYLGVKSKINKVHSSKLSNFIITKYA